MTPDIQAAIKHANNLMSPGWRAQRDLLLSQWRAKHELLQRIKAEEAALRKQLVDYAANPNVSEGTESQDLETGEKLKIRKTLLYCFTDKTAAKDLEAAFKNTDAKGEFLAERLIRWSPEVVVGEYRKLPEQYKAIADVYITSKPGMPEVKVE